MSLELTLFTEDALSNHFYAVIPTFPGVTDMVNTNLRILNVDIPPKVIDTYQVVKNGRKADRPSGISGSATSFTFTYRADKYMKVYKGFSAWMELIQNSQTGLGLGDAVPITGGISPIRVPIIVGTAEAGQIPSGTLWTILGAYPTEHGAITFDENSGDPLEVSVTMSYIDIVYPIV